MYWYVILSCDILLYWSPCCIHRLHQKMRANDMQKNNISKDDRDPSALHASTGALGITRYQWWTGFGLADIWMAENVCSWICHEWWLKHARNSDCSAQISHYMPHQALNGADGKSGKLVGSKTFVRLWSTLSPRESALWSTLMLFRCTWQKLACYGNHSLLFIFLILHNFFCSNVVQYTLPGWLFLSEIGDTRCPAHQRLRKKSVSARSMN